MDSQFENAFANGCEITQISSFNIVQSPDDSGLRHLVAQFEEPIVKWTAAIVLLVQDHFHQGISVA